MKTLIRKSHNGKDLLSIESQRKSVTKKDDAASNEVAMLSNLLGGAETVQTKSENTLNLVH